MLILSFWTNAKFPKLTSLAWKCKVRQMKESKLDYFELYNGRKEGSLPHSLFVVEIINTFITVIVMCNVFTTLVKDGFEDFAHMIENDYENTITNEKETYASIKQYKNKNYCFIFRGLDTR